MPDEVSTSPSAPTDADKPGVLTRLRRSARLAFWPILLGMLGATFRWVVEARGWTITDGQGLLTQGPMMVMATAGAIAAALILDSVWGKYQAFVKAVWGNGDRETYDRLLVERMPDALWVLLGSLILPVGLGALLIEYEAAWPVRGLVGFFIAFAGSTYVVVVKRLDNPLESVWIKGRARELQFLVEPTAVAPPWLPAPEADGAPGGRPPA